MKTPEKTLQTPMVRAVNRITLRSRFSSCFRRPFSCFLTLLVLCGTVITICALLFLLAYILIKGIPHINWDLFALQYNSENVSLTPALINTFTITALSLLIAAPLGIFSAIYLVEYARRGSRVVKVIRITAETLSGIPSIVYGLFGYLFFLVTLRWGYSMLAGGITMAVMSLPLMIRTTEEALKSVPDSYREGSFGLGAGKLRTVFRVILPCAVPGILAGIILSVGRVAGETAALMYTSGTIAAVPENLMGSGRTLAVHMYVLATEGLHIEAAYATAVILLVVVVGVIALSSFAAKRIGKNRMR